ncbi:MAG: triphosphoribosyl-dephospho-CoA synthase [Candidatus Hodarchaeota archaeon]
MDEIPVKIEDEMDIGRCCTLASLLEVSASPKPGNVHRFSKLDDHPMNYEQFLAAIAALSPHYLEVARASRMLVKQGKSLKGNLELGKHMKNAMESMMHSQDGGNLLLGHVLLLMPLAAACGALLEEENPTISNLQTTLKSVLESGTPRDVIHMYEGIRVSNPGGLGKVDKHDINSPRFKQELADDNADFIKVFSLNSNTDMISHEWTTGFTITFNEGFPRLYEFVSGGTIMKDAIVQVFLEILANHPDSLILRKNDLQVAKGISKKAKSILDQGGVFTSNGMELIQSLDRELILGKGKLNPGTTADLVASSILILLFCGIRP